MSIVPIIASTSAITATIAARKKKKIMREEEDMSGYDTNELEKWEFKIIRSSTNQFKKPEAVKKVREEEARFGWEMMEKFDDARIRFKRRIDMRIKDQYQQGDPYRTTYGISEGILVVVILSVIFGLTGLGLLIAYIISLNI